MPATGVYVFTYTVYVDLYKVMHAELVINGRVRNSMAAVVSATAISVLQVNAGDHVSVRNSDTNLTCNVRSSFDLGLTSFSGWRLF